MPHSSGGGGHGGGFHGGGYSRVRGGHGIHGTGAAGINNAAVIKNSPFEGGFKYMYYKHKKPHYFYADFLPRAAFRTNWKTLVVWMIIVNICFFAFALFVAGIYHNPVKLEPVVEEHYIIEDRMDYLVDDREDLENALESFYQKTGIVPAIVTVDYLEMMRNPAAKSSEEYAYNLYLQMFDDESHWLIVYSRVSTQPEKFRFEGMQGNDTDDILYTDIRAGFNTLLEDYLKEPEVYSTAHSFANAFNAINLLVMEKGVSTRPFMGICVLAFVITSAFVISAVIAYKEERFKNAVRVEEDMHEYYCSYCGGTYIKEISRICPFCSEE